MLEDPDGPEFFRFQFIGAVVNIVGKFSNNLVAIDVARNKEEPKLLLDIQNEFKVKCFDVKALSPRVFKRRIRVKKEIETQEKESESVKTERLNN